MKVAQAVEVTGLQRAEFAKILRSRTTSQAVAKRVRAVLLAAEGRENQEIAGQLAMGINGVSRWRRRFRRGRDRRAAPGSAALWQAPIDSAEQAERGRAQGDPGEAARANALEPSNPGRRRRTQPINRWPDPQGERPQAASRRDIQAQQRQEVRRKADGRRRSLPLTPCQRRGGYSTRPTTKVGSSDSGLPMTGYAKRNPTCFLR